MFEYRTIVLPLNYSIRRLSVPWISQQVRPKFNFGDCTKTPGFHIFKSNEHNETYKWNRKNTNNRNTRKTKQTYKSVDLGQLCVVNSLIIYFATWVVDGMFFLLVVKLMLYCHQAYLHEIYSAAHKYGRWQQLSIILWSSWVFEFLPNQKKNFVLNQQIKTKKCHEELWINIFC